MAATSMARVTAARDRYAAVLFYTDPGPRITIGITGAWDKIHAIAAITIKTDGADEVTTPAFGIATTFYPARNGITRIVARLLPAAPTCLRIRTTEKKDQHHQGAH